MRTEDGYLIHKCLNGDTEAFGFLVDKYRASVYASAYAMLLNFHDAEDASQEVFIKAYKNLRSLRRWDSFASWLYRITANTCKERVRAASRRPEYEPMEERVSDRRALDSHRDGRVFESLHEALDDLPEMHRQVLTLHYFGGMTSSEIARFIGMAPATIRRRLIKARGLLKAEMLDTTSAVFEEQRLQASFTLRIMEQVKHIRLRPLPRLAERPWAMSAGTVMLAVILSLGIFDGFQNTMNRYMKSATPEEAGSAGTGEIFVDIVEQKAIERKGDTSMLNNRKMNILGVLTAILGILSGNAMGQTELTKYVENPVLNLGAPGEFDDSSVSNPVVLYDDGIYKMWYNGSGGDPCPSYRVGYATSPDGINWEKHGVVLDVGSGWERCAVMHPVVLRDGDTYKMWYTGHSGTGGQMDIGYATSPDGINWTKYDWNPVFKGADVPGVDELYLGSVIFDDAIYKMWYHTVSASGGDIEFPYIFDIRYATSTDGINWADQGQVLTPGAPDAWDNSTVSNPSVLFNNGKYEMWYSGANTSMKPEVGYAISEDGVAWTKSSYNPVLSKGSVGEWDAQSVWSPRVILEGTIYKMWYPGRDIINGIGYATAPINQNIDDYVVLAENSVYIKQNATILSGLVGVNDDDGVGPYLTNYEMTVGINALTKDAVNLSATTIKLKRKATVEGDALYRDDLIIGDNAVIMGEQTQAPDRFPLFNELPGSPPCSPGTDPVVVPPGGYRELPAGAYGDVMVRKNGTLVLTGGDYDLNSFDTGTGVNVYFTEPTTLRIAEKFDTDQNTYFGPEPGNGTLAADDISVYACGINGNNGNLGATPKAAQIGLGNEFYGRVYAPNGAIWVRQNSHAVGSFIGKDIIVGIGATIARTGAMSAPSTAYKESAGSDSDSDLQLAQNYPNPFNPETWIPYRLSEGANVSIKIHSASGQLVRTLDLGYKAAGLYSNKAEAAHWDGTNENGEYAASGVYFYSIQAGSKLAATRKMLVLK